MCWGDTEAPRGLGSTPDPQQLDGLQRHFCALLGDGPVACWGRDSFGESTVPDGTCTTVSAGGDHTCALQVDGTATCWGDDDSGETQPP